MSSRDRDVRLPFWYRLWYGIRYTTMHLFGPAQLSGSQDPHVRLQREREAKLAQLRARQQDPPA